MALLPEQSWDLVIPLIDNHRMPKKFNICYIWDIHQMIWSFLRTLIV